MFRTAFAFAVAAAFVPAMPAEASDSSYEVAQACGWYAIVGCSRSWEGANREAPPGTYVVNTGDYPNFRPGWFCAVDGPYASQRQVPIGKWRQWRGDAYVKNAC